MMVQKRPYLVIPTAAVEALAEWVFILHDISAQIQIGSKHSTAGQPMPLFRYCFPSASRLKFLLLFLTYEQSFIAFRSLFTSNDRICCQPVQRWGAVWNIALSYYVEMRILHRCIIYINCKSLALLLHLSLKVSKPLAFLN